MLSGLGSPLLTSDYILSACPGRIDPLKLLGLVLFGDLGQAHVNRQRRAYALSPVHPGAHTNFSSGVVRPVVRFCS